MTLKLSHEYFVAFMKIVFT